MDITKDVLTQDLIEKGYTAIETVQDAIVTLCYKGEAINDYYGCKAKHICSAAMLHYSGVNPDPGAKMTMQTVCGDA